MTDIVHLCVSNRSHPGLDLLLASSSRIPNLQTRVLGLGNSTPIGHGGKGFGLKMQLLKRELELLPPLQVVLFTDAWDVLLQGSPQGLLAWVAENPGKVLFAAETTKWPDKNLLYPVPLQFPFPFLNSGVFAGRCQDILKLLQAPFSNETDDQQFYAQQFCSETSNIVLDHKADHFLCMHGISRFSVTQKNAHVLFNNKVPFVLHLNNGLTRFKWFPFVTEIVLGPLHVQTARRIVANCVIDALWQAKVFVLLIVLLFVWKCNFFET